MDVHLLIRALHAELAEAEQKVVVEHAPAGEELLKRFGIQSTICYDGDIDKLSSSKMLEMFGIEMFADDEIVAVDLYLAGRSLVALRAAELLAIAAELKRRTGLAPELVAEGRFATAAKFASAADASAFSSVRFQNEPKPFLESLKARDYLSFADSGAICSACAAGSGLD